MANEDNEKLSLPAPTGDPWVDLAAMHKHYGFPPTDGKKIDAKHLKHRLDFIKEELDETYEAMHELDDAGFIDGLIDMVVVIAGTLEMLKVNSKEAFVEVMTANMNKQVGQKDGRPNSDGVDLIKPDGWKAPDMGKFVTSELTEIFTEIAQRGVEERSERGVVRVLQQCIDLFKAKSHDYVFPGSTVVPADYYPNGIDDIVYMIDVLKRLRQNSILDKMRAGADVKFEGLEDTMVDRIVYLAIGVEYLRGQCPGQNSKNDIFNKSKEFSGTVYIEKHLAPIK